jgi:hypothetical protein
MAVADRPDAAQGLNGVARGDALAFAIDGVL